MSVLSPPGKTEENSKKEKYPFSLPERVASITLVGRHLQTHHGNGDQTHERIGDEDETYRKLAQ
jgi:hypothetical protein